MPLTATYPQLRWAGLAYLTIILAGVGSEAIFRPLALAATDPATQETALRLSLMLDTLMLTADIIVALLFFSIFRRVSQGLALSAMIFRLVQAALIGASLMLQLVALHAPEMAPALLAAQADGYDLGLIFFALNTALMAQLLCRAEIAPSWLPPLLMASAAVYLAGSLSALLAPDVAAKIELAYLIPLLSETAFCLWLLLGHRHMANAAA